MALAFALTLVFGLAAPAARGGPRALGLGRVTNGSVLAVASDGSGRTYLGGDFTQVGPRTGHGLKLTSASDQPAGEFPEVAGGPSAL